ncbi:MAG: hypothetical protein K8W52_25580 [Deltaproteobacteria bacterium]|nr:hypothetical protein [Deltaproteobacteria bacterium]
MDTDPILEWPTGPALDARALLARIDPMIARLRRALGHDHRDEAAWVARGMTVRDAQAMRARLRVVANLLHVERAHQRGRLHGTRFATLEAQAAWLTELEYTRCGPCARAARLSHVATLAALRRGMLPVHPVDEDPLSWPRV